jgi:hypothetical protein
LKFGEFTKQERQSNGKVITLYSCSCAICDRCWFNPKLRQCIYAGPHSGYVEVSDDTER